MIKLNLFKKPKQIVTKTAKSSLLVKLSVFLIIVFMAMQLHILTSVGTQGQKVSELRRLQAEVKLQNEIKRARVQELQASSEIKETATTRLQMEPAAVIIIDDSLLQATAQR